MINSLEDAIKHCNEVAERLEGKNGYAYTDVTCEECAKEHRQLAEWLKELKYYKDRQDLINKNWQELTMYKDGIEKIKMRSQAYRERGETVLASGMEQALDILKEVNADDGDSC
jgi:predicted DsbA family dithiol-disulfide isomerase